MIHEFHGTIRDDIAFVMIPGVSRDELFALIHKFPGYAIGTDGTFWSKWKEKGWQPYSRTRFIGREWWQMKPWSKDLYGHKNIDIKLNGRRYTPSIASIVLETFRMNRPQGLMIRHLNGIASDNRLVNLCYGTRRENTDDMLSHGHMPRGEDRHNAILTGEDIVEIRKSWSSGEMQKDIARRFGIDKSHVSHIVRRKCWRHVA